jgi:hypothetical protein
MDFNRYVINHYPQRPSKPQLPKRNPTAKEAREYAKEIEEYEKKHEEYIKLRNQVKRDETTLLEAFWNDAFEEVGINKDHPKAPLLSRMAWEDGHSEGLESVMQYIVKYSEFLQD